MFKKDCGESPLLQDLLPKPTLQLASSLSNDDKEVLIYLVTYGRRVMLAMGATYVCKSPWKPWKSSSRASRREEVVSLCTKSFAEAEEVPPKRSSWLPANHKTSFTCDCFPCYSTFWGRWNASPNRDLINEILDAIEEGPRSSRGKKKRRQDKKRDALPAEACAGKPGENLHHKMEELMVMHSSDDTSRSLDLIGKASEAVMDGTPHASIKTDEAPNIFTQTPHTRCKKSMFRVTKQKEEACVTTLKSPDLRVDKVSGTTVIDDAASLALSPGSDRENDMEVGAAIEVFENFTSEASEVISVCISPATSVCKNASRLPRTSKRRHNQVMPLDCEGLSDVEGKQEVSITVDSTQAIISPRAADIGLGGRGLLARVFPDALGRVASRLWDLVSVRLRSRTVEYH